MINSQPFRITLMFSFIIMLAACNKPKHDSVKENNIDAAIFPDYNGITIPYNIAPINFIINDSADKYFVEIIPERGKSIKVNSADGKIKIPIQKWRKLLKNNSNRELQIIIFTQENGRWNKFNPVIVSVSDKKIDNYLVYRFINPANILWHSMGIYQRNLESFSVSPIMDNSLTERNCMNCHSFAANNANTFMFHMRGKPGGTIIYSAGELKFVNTKTEQTISAGGYPAWHPGGKLIAFSTNKIHQRFHAAKEKYAFVYDDISDIILFDVEKMEVQAIPELSKSDFENMPTWSPDGKYLYFLTTPYHKPDTGSYQDIKYDLKRISYNIETNTWGEIEALISSKKLGKSIAFPRVSPDNRYVAICISDYGYFTVYNETSDIAILDLETMQIDIPNINSEFVESYPSWSANGKWLMFNSKRSDGISSRPYFSYFDNGKAFKPFLLPQKDPIWNVTELNNINRPEFATSKIPLNPQKILRLVKDSPMPVGFDENSISVNRDSLIEFVNANNSFNFDQ